MSPVSSVHHDLNAYVSFMEGREYLDIDLSLPLSERFRRIRHNYVIYRELVQLQREWRSHV